MMLNIATDSMHVLQAKALTTLSMTEDPDLWSYNVLFIYTYSFSLLIIVNFNFNEYYVNQ